MQEARAAASLPAHVTLAACRHGGMTELGDSDLTEQQIMALSTHATPQAARVYVKRTEAQRKTAARKRRLFIEAQVQERKPDKSSEWWLDHESECWRRKGAKRLKTLAGAPGFEPGNGGNQNLPHLLSDQRQFPQFAPRSRHCGSKACG